jgi:hypothetical protein
VATSVAAFVGFTTKGPLGEPTRITKYDAYEDEFGGVRDTKKDTGDPMGHSVLSFFQNGGTTAYIVRITRNWENDSARANAGETKDAVKAMGYMDHPSTENISQALKFTAVNEGKWANGLVATIETVDVAEGDPPLYDVAIGRYSKKPKPEFEAIETFSNVSLDSSDPQFISSAVDGVSALVEVSLVSVGEAQATREEYLLGTSTSDELSGDLHLKLDGWSDLDMTLHIRLDGSESAKAYKIPARDYETLDELASEIQKAVRGATKTDEARANFTCLAQDNWLVLTSGTRTEDSAVEVQTGNEEKLAETLSLGVANSGVENTGKESAAAVWTSTDITAADEAMLAGGFDGFPPATADYRAVFAKFVKIREISVMVLPGQAWLATGASNPVVDAAIAHAEKMKSRVVIVDPPEGKEFTTPKQVADLGLPTSTYTVLYYPWVKVANPFYHPERNPGAPKTLLVSPSGFAAGMWSKIDARRGVWKAPAGVETRLLGVAGLQYTVEDGEQDVLNPLGVNAIRTRPNFGSVIWGARTLSTKADPEWRYVPVRRTAIMIEQSIYGGIQWAVFEPNDHRLWSALRANIGGFMDGLFRSGAFQGEKASDAYFVRCGKGDTMTQGDIDAGRVIVIVGFAPLKPAEFVIVRIQQKVGQQ